MAELAFAYIAGLLTLINPCVIPLLPIVLAGSIGRNRFGPLAMAAGLAVSFTVFGFAAYAFAQGFGLQTEDIARIGALVMIGFGAVLLVPRAQETLARAAAGVAGGSSRAIDAVEDRGLAGQAAAGALMGLVWSPCIGPTLGGAIALASLGESLGRAFAVMAAFSAGAGTIVIGLAYGAREIVARRHAALVRVSKYAKPVMGIALIAVGLGIWFHLDRLIELWALETLPAWFTDLSVRF